MIIQERLNRHQLFLTLESLENTDNLLLDAELKQMIGTNSKFGEVWKASLPIETHLSNPLIAIKKVPMTDTDLRIMKRKDKPEKFLAMRRNIWIELYFLKKCNDIVRSKICPSFSLIFFYAVQPKAKFQNPRLKESNGSNGLWITMELAECDLKNWSRTKRNNNEWISCMFQILFAVLILQKKVKIIHNDLHWGNILVYTNNKKGYICYIYKKHKYYVPFQGAIFTISDFGFVTKYEIQESLKDMKRIANICDWVKNSYQYRNTFLETFRSTIRNSESLYDALCSCQKFLPKIQKDEVLEIFDIDASI